MCFGNKSPASTYILQCVPGQASKYKKTAKQPHANRETHLLSGCLDGCWLEGGYAKWAALTNALARAKKVPTQQSYSRVEYGEDRILRQ